MFVNVAIAGILCLCLQAVGPLSPERRIQLDTASDFDARFDSGALYPLLHDALGWQPGDESGAAVPDYQAIMKEPAKHRGQLFLIEGLYAGGARSIDSLSRPGPWDGKLMQWGVVVDPAKDEVVAVYLVDPPPAPSAGTTVRMPGRFYKVLADTDLKGNPTDYLLFIGRGASVQADSKINSTTQGTGAVLIVVALLAAGWYALRRSLRAKPLRSQARIGRASSIDHEGVEPEDEPEMDLPQDPAEALGTLERHHRESE